MAGAAKGLTSSIWFTDRKEVRKMRQAAKMAGVSLNELMRRGALAEAERVIAKAKKQKAAAEAAA